LNFHDIFEKYWNTKFDENLSSGSRVVPCGLIDGHTDISKLKVAFRNFANARKRTKGRRVQSCCLEKLWRLFTTQRNSEV